MNVLPKSVTKYFWGDELTELSWEKHRDYIVKTILEKGDSDSVKWLIGHTERDYLKQIVKEKKWIRNQKISGTYIFNKNVYRHSSWEYQIEITKKVVAFRV